MTNRNSSKRALLASVLSIVVCLSMLVGSTFAWFTDSASTAVNKIQSGTLDVGLEMYDEATGTWVNAEGKTLSFTNVNKSADILWEPGCTYYLPQLRIVNYGNLALKYQIVITGIDGDAKLNEAIEWTYTGAMYGDEEPWLAPEATTSNIVISGHMKEEAGNEYQDLSIEGIGITVLATQMTYEADYKDHLYDEHAPFGIIVRDQAALNAAMANATAETTLYLDAGLYEMPASVVEGVSVIGMTDGVIVTLPNNEGAAFDRLNMVDGYFENVTFAESVCLTGSGTFVDCVFELGTNTVTANGDITFEGCTFDSTGAGDFALHIDAGNNTGKLTVKNCDFVNGAIAYKGMTSATFEDSTFSGEYSWKYMRIYVPTTLTNCVFVCAESDNSNVSGSELVQNNVTWSAAAADAEGLAKNTDTEAKTVSIETAGQMFAFAKEVNENKNNYAGYTVTLAADINLLNVAWTPIGQTGATEFKGVFDGNGHTISNLYVNNTDTSANCASGLFGWIESHGSEGVTVKNLTVDGATVSGYHNVAVIVGYVYGTIENCHVKNATVNCTAVNADANGDKCGLIAGYVGEDATITGCTGADSTVSAGRDAGQIVGAAKPACVTDCSATNVTVTANGSSTGKNINETVIGRKL